MITFKKFGGWKNHGTPTYYVYSNGVRERVIIYGVRASRGHGRHYSVYVNGMQREDAFTLELAKKIAIRAVASKGHRIVAVRQKDGPAVFDIFNAQNERIETVSSFYAAASKYPAAIREWEAGVSFS